MTNVAKQRMMGTGTFLLGCFCGVGATASLFNGNIFLFAFNFTGVAAWFYLTLSILSKDTE